MSEVESFYMFLPPDVIHLDCFLKDISARLFYQNLRETIW